MGWRSELESGMEARQKDRAVRAAHELADELMGAGTEIIVLDDPDVEITPSGAYVDVRLFVSNEQMESAQRKWG